MLIACSLHQRTQNSVVDGWFLRLKSAHVSVRGPAVADVSYGGHCYPDDNCGNRKFPAVSARDHGEVKADQWEIQSRA